MECRERALTCALEIRWRLGEARGALMGMWQHADYQYQIQINNAYVKREIRHGRCFRELLMFTETVLQKNFQLLLAKLCFLFLLALPCGSWLDIMV
ncbi:hypothetical protein NDU88_005759 [Pleurodeles waltl]|uniref:Uncharacterized protein n=1 Tax=Pleurodeles waltl TaxID=8319 RepID=A0AAV7NNC7_PLEWA|nr:hypothetical protein NDU88_005759 [Pleurodeles waltl]